MLTAFEFTLKFIEKIRTMVSPEDNKRIKALVAEFGNKRIVKMDDAYTEYEANPDQLDAILDRYCKLTLKVVQNPPAMSVDLKLVLPMVQADLAVVPIREDFSEETREMERTLYREPFADGLVVTYVMDWENTIQPLSNEDIAGLKVSKEELRRQSIINLHGRMGEVELISTFEGFYVLKIGGTYETSMMLLDALWTSKRLKLKGDPVVGVPAKGNMMITGSKDKENIQTAKKCCRIVFKERSWPISKKLYVYQKGVWNKFKA